MDDNSADISNLATLKCMIANIQRECLVVDAGKSARTPTNVNQWELEPRLEALELLVDTTVLHLTSLELSIAILEETLTTASLCFQHFINDDPEMDWVLRPVKHETYIKLVEHCVSSSLLSAKNHASRLSDVERMLLEEEKEYGPFLASLIAIDDSDIRARTRKIVEGVDSALQFSATVKYSIETYKTRAALYAENLAVITLLSEVLVDKESP